MHVFTSITANYLPKAAALAHSVKRVHPEAIFTSCCRTIWPDCPSSSPRLLIRSSTSGAALQICHPGFSSTDWSSCDGSQGHRLPAHCRRVRAERIYYFDPDILVCDRLDGLNQILDRRSVLPYSSPMPSRNRPHAITTTNICCMRNGVFNLGFLAVRMTGLKVGIHRLVGQSGSSPLAMTKFKWPFHGSALG